MSLSFSSRYFSCYKILKTALTAVFLALIVINLSSCSKTPDEEQIAIILDEMTSAIENGKPVEIAKHLHKDFRANEHMTAKQVKQMLMMYGMQHSSISVTRVSTQTELDSIYTDKAMTEMSVIVTSASGHGRLPTDGSVRVVKMEWRKDGDWKVLKANWQHY